MHILVKYFSCLFVRQIFKNFPKTIDYISLATYARLNLTKYIKNIEKAIYIDVDTLTNSSLQELWDIDITDYYLAACRDTFIDVKNEAYKKIHWFRRIFLF